MGIPLVLTHTRSCHNWSRHPLPEILPLVGVFNWSSNRNETADVVMWHDGRNASVWIVLSEALYAEGISWLWRRVCVDQQRLFMIHDHHERKLGGTKNIIDLSWFLSNINSFGGMLKAPRCMFPFLKDLRPLPTFCPSCFASSHFLAKDPLAPPRQRSLL